MFELAAYLHFIALALLLTPFFIRKEWLYLQVRQECLWNAIAILADCTLYVWQVHVKSATCILHFASVRLYVLSTSLHKLSHVSLNGVLLIMSAVNSLGDYNGPSYFWTEQRPVASEPDSPAISPSTQSASASVRPNRRSRPPVRPHPRPRSDDISGHSRFNVQTTIHENEAIQNRSPLGSTETPPHKSSRASAVTPLSDGGDFPQSRAPRSIAPSQRTSSSYTSVRSIARRYLQRFNSTSQKHHAIPTPNAIARPTHRRARSDSAASRARSSNSLPRRKTRSVDNFARRRFQHSSESHKSAASPTATLCPPFSTNVREHSTAHRHEIKLETPFSLLPRDPSEAGLCKEPPSSRRTSAIQPRAIFSAPVNVVRRFRKPSYAKPDPQIKRSSSPSISETHGRMLGHVSQLRRKRTHEALRQVSQLLRFIAGDKPDGLPIEPMPMNTRTMSTKSTPSIKESKEGRKISRKPTQGLPHAPLRVATQKSMELDLRESDSSSIRDLRLGPPPNATPDPNATYKVKRSQSAETEEFLKVDISVRGGTSYLPSEARRIHTPPLPGEGAGGKRRGFFFDYNAPRHLSVNEMKSKTTDSTEKKSAVLAESGIDRVQVSWNNVSSVSGRIVHSKESSRNLPVRTVPKRKAVEWFDTKLAELDTSTDEDASEKGKSKHEASSPGFFELRQRTAQALHDMRTRRIKIDDEEELLGGKVPIVQVEELEEEDEEEEEEERGEIDYNVPEHYPTSPLCPANVRYWRFVDGKLGKGRFTRTCWMHGDLSV